MSESKRSEGRATWQPAARLATFNKDPDKRYKWCDQDPANIERKEAEGWSVVNDVTGNRADHGMEQNRVDGAKRHRELVLMAMPEEVAQARTEHYREITDHQAQNTVDTLKSQAAELGGEITGKIVIE